MSILKGNSEFCFGLMGEGMAVIMIKQQAKVMEPSGLLKVFKNQNKNRRMQNDH